MYTNRPHGEQEERQLKRVCLDHSLEPNAIPSGVSSITPLDGVSTDRIFDKHDVETSSLRLENTGYRRHDRYYDDCRPERLVHHGHEQIDVAQSFDKSFDLWPGQSELMNFGFDDEAQSFDKSFDLLPGQSELMNFGFDDEAQSLHASNQAYQSQYGNSKAERSQSAYEIGQDPTRYMWQEQCQALATDAFHLNNTISIKNSKYEQNGLSPLPQTLSLAPPDHQGEPNGHLGVPGEVFSKQICYGMLDKIPVHCRQSNSLVPDVGFLRILFDTGSEAIQLRSDTGQVIGTVDSRYSSMFKILKSEEGIESQAYVVPLPPQKSANRRIRTNEGRKQISRSQVRPCTLSVIWYGPIEMLDDVGEFFLRCSEYLQCPVHCDRNVPYRNPQSLSGRDEDPPMTFGLQKELSLSEFETLVEGADPSALLQCGGSLLETEPPVVIRTPLYSHQKQALTFMLMREQGHESPNDPSRCWRPFFNEADGMTQYVNIESGKICDCDPGAIKGGILADAMGLGKSLSVISLLATDWPNRAKGLPPTLLVVPPSLLHTWEDELKRHTQSDTLSYWKYHGPKRTNIVSMLGYDIVLTSYDVVASEWRNLDVGLKSLYSYSWHRIVLDEAHEIRSGNTVRAKAIYALSGRFRWACSGTPIQNRLEDLASLLRFLKVYPDNNTGHLKTLLRSNAASARMRTLLNSICLRRSKDAIKLPRRTDKIRRVEFEADEAGHYNNMSDFVASNLRGEAGQTCLGTYSDMLAKINLLRQICNLGMLYQTSMHHSTGSKAQSAMMQNRFDGMLSAGAANCSQCDRDLVQGDSDSLGRPQLATCGEIICASCLNPSETTMTTSHNGCQRQESCKLFAVDVTESATIPTRTNVSRFPVKIRALQNDLLVLPITEKSIVFSFWTTTLDVVSMALTEVGIPYTRVDGTMTRKERQHSLTSLTEDDQVRVILISLRCGSAGLTLTAANNVFLMEPQWNPMLEDQAFDRVYRIGQTKEVTTIRYIVKGTLEESIRHQQLQKRNLAEQAFAIAKREDDWKERLRAMLTKVPR